MSEGTPAWIVAAGIAGTYLIFGAAIWGERLRSWLFKPQLHVELVNPRGVSMPFTISPPDQEPYQRPGRFYHVEVVNANRWPIAHGVQILITRIERLGPDGAPITAWTGEIPLVWDHPEIQPFLRTVGRPARAVLVTTWDDRTTGERAIELMPVIQPTNFPRRYDTATRLWVTLRARADEADSAERRFGIFWDGQWDEGESEMAQLLKVTHLG